MIKPIRQRKNSTKELFTVWMPPALRERLREVAAEGDCSMSFLLMSWLDTLLRRYTNISHVPLDGGEWGVEWSFNDGRVIWAVVASEGRVKNVHRSINQIEGTGNEVEQSDISAGHTREDRARIKEISGRIVRTMAEKSV